MRSALSNPFIYEAFQKIMGANSLRRKIVADYVTPYTVNSILDIGCGPAEILAFLPKLDYYGFDVSRSYIDTAKIRFGHKGNFFAQQLTDDILETLPTFDLVLMFGVLHHLDDNVARDVIRLSKSALKDNGRLLTIDPVFTPKQNPIARFLVSKERGQNVRTEQGYASLTKDIFTETNMLIQHKIWVPYSHCIMECIR